MKNLIQTVVLIREKVIKCQKCHFFERLLSLCKLHNTGSFKQTYLGENMKTFQSMIIATLMILVSASLTAAPLPDYGSGFSASTLVMSAASSKDAAYQSGLSKLKQLKAMSSEELSQVLDITAFNINERTLHLKDGYVTVEERMDADGKITFVSKVNVESHYVVKPTKN